MSRESVGKLIDLWINDQSFRSSLRIDHEKAVRNSGIELDDEEWAALRNIDWGLSDEVLRSQISKGM